MTIKSPQHNKKILVSGAGPAGLAFAIGLNKSPLSITLVDAKPKPDLNLLNSDTRMIALSKSSYYFLASIGIWDLLAPHATPIESVHVSQKGFRKVVKMSACDHQLDNFGYLIPMGKMVIALQEKIETQQNVIYKPETELISYHVDGKKDKAKCVFNRNGEKEEENFDWVISAEGMNSPLRNLAGIETFYKDYEQIAVIATGEFEKPHHNIAYERFTSSGPLALLPIENQKMAIVLIVPSHQKQEWQSASEAKFIDEVVFRFGNELGDLRSVTERHIWDLTLMIPKKLVAPKLTLIGNSAHALHPIAGQGLNLGFRDCELLIPYFEFGIPTEMDLQRYERIRRNDICKIVGATDFLVRTFDLSCFPLPYFRDLALRGISVISPLKRKIAQFGMGL